MMRAKNQIRDEFDSSTAQFMSRDGDLVIEIQATGHLYDSIPVSLDEMIQIIKSLLNHRIKIYDANMDEIEDLKNLEPQLKRQHSSEEADDDDEELEELATSVKRSRLH